MDEPRSKIPERRLVRRIAYMAAITVGLAVLTVLAVEVLGPAALLAIIGIVFGAFCLWLTVRVINRRERWAKRMLVAIVICARALYVLSLGPVRWIAWNGYFPKPVMALAERFYAPLELLPGPVRDVIVWYALLWD